MSGEPSSTGFGDVRGVALDLSGVLYVGAIAIAGAPSALHRLRESGLPLRFVTNVTRLSPNLILAHLVSLGFDVARDELVTATDAARAYIARHHLNPYLLVHPKIRAEFVQAEDREFDAVLVGDAQDAFTYDAMNRAFRVLSNGGPLLAMGNNRYFRDRDDLSLDIGPFVAALEFASGQQAVVLGKPSSEFFHAAAMSMQCQPSQALMVGDDVLADVNGALDAGMQAVLVRTGKFRVGDEKLIAPGQAHVCSDIGAAVDLVLAGVQPIDPG